MIFIGQSYLWISLDFSHFCLALGIASGLYQIPACSGVIAKERTKVTGLAKWWALSFVPHFLCFPEWCFPLCTWTSLSLFHPYMYIKTPTDALSLLGNINVGGFLWRLDLWLWKIPCAAVRAQGFWFSAKTKVIAEEFLDEFYPEPLINTWKKKVIQRDVLPVLDHVVFYCFFIVLQQKAVGKLIATKRNGAESEQNEKTPKE